MPRRSNFALQAQSYGKSRAEQNKLFLFLCRDGVISRCKRKVTESREQNKINCFYFYAETE